MAGVSVRRVEDIAQALWGTRVSPGTVSEMNKKIYSQIETWRNLPIKNGHPYVYLDGICLLKRSWGGEVPNVAILVAVGVAEGAQEDEQSWMDFLRQLKQRGLDGVQMFISDKCLGLIEALGKF